MTKDFVHSIEGFAASEGVDLIRFQKGQRKDEVAAPFGRWRMGTQRFK